jgi:hypothetical protein
MADGRICCATGGALQDLAKGRAISARFFRGLESSGRVAAVKRL